MKDKKGALLFAPMLLILMIVGLIYAYSEISARYKEFNKEIGEKQFELINTYQKAEKAMFYIDQSAKYSAYQGIYDLAKNGGCRGGNVYGTYRLWSVDNPKPSICFPSTEDAKNGFFDFFSNGFNNYLSSYKAFNLPLNNYELSFDGATLTGIAKEPLNIPIIEDASNINLGAYSVKAPFKVNIGNYDFSDYDALRLEAQELIDACNDRAPSLCVDEKKQDFFDDGTLKLEKCPSGAPETKFLDFVWDSNVRYSIYGLCVNKTDEPLVYAYDPEEDATGYKNIAYKFALQFRDLECNLGNHPDLINTKCTEQSCDAYYDCEDATPLCYCGAGTGNACQGKCLPLCSADPGKIVDASTKCTKYSCGNYWSCRDSNVCGCPDPSNPNFDNACRGLDCDTLHCDRDLEFENDKKIKTKCLSSCSKYGDCSSTNLCACDSGLSACQGSCYCNPQEWKSTGGCGDKKEDGVQCKWNEMPQKMEYSPNTCSSPDYKCEPQPPEVCPPLCAPHECAGPCKAYDENCNIIQADDCC